MGCSQAKVPVKTRRQPLPGQAFAAVNYNDPPITMEELSEFYAEYAATPREVFKPLKARTKAEQEKVDKRLKSTLADI